MPPKPPCHIFAAMKNIFCFLLLALCCACAPDDKPGSAQSGKGGMVAPPPKTVTLKSGSNSVGGTGITRDGKTTTTTNTAAAIHPNDLNGDGDIDRLEVVTTKEENDGLGFKRQLVVYTGEGADLDAWYTADDVLLSTKHGGTMGDPLESVEINNGTIVIKHAGGSRTKWRYVHRFRWIADDFQLVGTTIENDDPCAKYTVLEYDLTSNAATYATTERACEGEEARDLETITVNFDASVYLPSMQGFKTGENELDAKGMSKPIYF